MHIWLITVGEPLPTDDPGRPPAADRHPGRSAAGQGHEVTWWTSAFDHIRKRHRAEGDRQDRTGRRLPPLVAARQRLSPQRFPAAHRQSSHRGQKVSPLAPQQPRPDVIICSWPTVELCVEAVRLGKLWDVPVVLDVRDLWPDRSPIYMPSDVTPRGKASATRCLSVGRVRGIPRYRHHRDHRSIRGLGQWPTQAVGALRSIALSRWATSTTQPSPAEIRDAKDFWAQHGIAQAGQQHFIACWFGMMGNHSELATVIEAARKWSHPEIPFASCCVAPAPNLERCRRLAGDCQNILSCRVG